MPWFSLRRDGVVLLVFGLLSIMLAAGLAGSDRVFAFTLTGLLGTLAAVGFVRRGRRFTWLPPALATTVLALSFAGMFTHEGAVVARVEDTVLGFHPATAYLIYGLWLPAFLTLGLGFAMLFDQVSADASQDSGHDDEVSR